MSAKTTVFLTGATGTIRRSTNVNLPTDSFAPGYLGGTVLARLLNHPDRKNFDITVLVRNEDKAKILAAKFGLHTVIGSHQDVDKVASAAEAAHVVFNIVSFSDVCMKSSY